ncbi:ubiquitin carboxyl-terminal hydrolase MINDY-1 isoform X2 [Syngnathoides biaculeatus]|uniref:ubiquitin carboxyl-terminal hydrolase MINDY-1 isoform X2 n=1 Tax=Syngnathoides biaculeatus TaxID=300417 RepID=UPI002ADD4AD5|nr:ubiquitin carboxyl-terminal hydrolase MINDY-1 isoform X2 [Syngnathoides biaculeatus]
MSAPKPASEDDGSSRPPPAATDAAEELTVAVVTAGEEVTGQLAGDDDQANREEGEEPTASEIGPTPDNVEEMPGGGVTGPDAEAMESFSVATGDSSDELRESSDSASFSIPSLDLSEGTAGAAGSLRDADDVLAEGCSPADEAPSMKDDEAAGGAVPGDAPAGASAAYYLVKWITWKEKKTPIITQSDNGPCPLLAIMNILFLRWKAKLPPQTDVVTTEVLMAHLGECVLSAAPREKTNGMELNFQQNMSDAMAVLPKLSTGLDVNVRFTGVTDFEYTPECIVFDLLDIPLYHGWLVDPQSPEMAAAVGKLSYNQLVEKIIDCKHSADSQQVSEGLAAEHFLETTATQLSYHGLCELNAAAKEGEMCVFFRNNHFSTMIKHKGFLREEGLVWESLHNVEGDGNFCDSDFRLCHAPQRDAAAPGAAPPPGDQQQQRQIDQDYLVAVSLQQESGAGGASGQLSDLELARQLQEEEYQQQQQQQQQQGSQHAAAQVRGQGSQPGAGRRREKDSDCVLL